MLVIYGPTQTGKTSLAINLARKYNGELVSADSRQVYKGLDIGSGKVDFSDTVEKYAGYWIVNGVRINGFDLADPGQQFSAADFLEFAKSSISRIIDKKNLPIIVGGTGFYIKALFEGIDSIGVPSDPELRRKLEKLSTDALYQKLFKLSKNRTESMNESDKANPRRLIRAIEIAIHKKDQGSEIKDESNSQFPFRLETRSRRAIPNSQYLFLGLTAPNEFLFKKADRWLAERIDHGLINEVRDLLENGVDYNWLENLGLEYRWITKYLLDKNSYEESLLRLKGDIHSFVRRQKTWFPKFKNIKLFDISSENFGKSLEKTVSLWYTKENERRKNFA